MKAFLAACVALTVIAVCAAVVLDRVNKPVDEAFASEPSVRNLTLSPSASHTTEIRRSSPARPSSCLRTSSASPSVSVSEVMTPAPSCGCLTASMIAVGAGAQRDAHIFAPALFFL